MRLRDYNDAEDYWRVRSFLRELLPLNDFRERAWAVYRWDYCRWHVWENIVQPRLEDIVVLWERPDGRIAAPVNREEDDLVFVQVHPALRTPAFEDELIRTAEERLAVANGDGSKHLRIWAHADDTLRQDVLRRRGYCQESWTEYQRRRSLLLPIPAAPVPAGFSVRALGDADEHPARSWASWRAFHPDEPSESYEGWSWYANVQRAPLYRRDLDLVVVAPDGAIASFCTIWFDDVTRTGAFEPVGTPPEYQRLGLGKAIMTEGLRRLQHLGAVMAYVASSGSGAHALYASVGFTDYELHVPWRRVLE